MSGPRRNIAANFTGRVWGVGAVYLFIPLFLRFLGPEAYGVVGFYAVLQGMLVIADMGLSATMSREMARIGAGGDPQSERRDLARSLEILYVGIAIVVGGIVVWAAPEIATRWLHARTLALPVLTESIRFMGIALALQFPFSLYFGGLLGLERQVAANAMQIAWGILRSGGVALALWLIAPTLRVFFASMVVANLIALIAMRITYWRALGSAVGARFRSDLLKRTWRYTAGMAVMTLLTTLLVQLDKLVVSRLVPLSTFAHYSLASALAQAPSIVAMAVASAVFPRLTGLVASGERKDLQQLYHEASQLTAVIAIPLGLTLAAFAPDVLLFWTRSAATTATAGPTARLLLMGSTALALQLIPYHLALAYGWVGLNLRLASVSLVILGPLLWWLVSHTGLPGAGWGWLILNVGTLPIMVLWLHHRVMPGASLQWAVQDIGRPLVATILVLAAAVWLAGRFPLMAHSFAFAVGVGIAALVAAVALSPSARSWIARGSKVRATS